MWGHAHWLKIWWKVLFWCEFLPINTILCNLFFWHAGTPQSVFAWFSSDQITIEFIFGPTTKRFDIKTTMHPYLRFNLTYIDTQAFIPIPAPLAAREEVSDNTGRLWNSFMKHETQPTWFTLHLWALYSPESFHVAFVRSWESEERLKKIVLSAKHSISFNAIYFLHSVIIN